MTPGRVMTPRGYWREVPAWEPEDMTVCIAAVSDVSIHAEPKIILCTDGKLSSALGDTEHALKDHALSIRWRCLTAGNEAEISAVLPLLKKAFNRTGIDETNAVEVVRSALRQRLLDKREEFIQGRYAFSYERFLKEGKIILPDDQFRSTALQVEMLTLRAQFIIAGFSTDGFPMIMETDERGTVKIRDGFAVIGDGAILAQSALVHRGHTEAFGFNRALYCVYEAKKLAERVTSVGRYENIIIMNRNLTLEMVNANGRQFLWGLWLDHGPKDLPAVVKRKQKSSMLDTIIKIEEKTASSPERSF